MEVTVQRYRECVTAGFCTVPDAALAYFRDRANDSKPMLNTPPPQMIAFCGWAGGRLPTEAEWERAARGDDGRAYPWGEAVGCDYANWAGCNDDVLPVGSFPGSASPYGLLDMIGNVAEITSDEWADGGYDAYDPPLSACDPAFPYRESMFANRVGRGCGTTRLARDSDGSATMAACTAFDRYAGGGFLAAGWRCARDGNP